MSITDAIAAVAFLSLVSYGPGWAIARAASMPADAFTRLWIGVVLTSVVGLLLGLAGRFSLVGLTIAAATVTLVALGLARRRDGAPPPAGAPGVDPGQARVVAAIAAVAALATVCWSWPPYETVIAASDSTMYVNAGAHLARTGCFTVPETLASRLPADAAGALFPSVGWFQTGPFIRLPGGLLMSSLDAGVATPAFFPLLPVWAAMLAVAGGVEATVLVAPLATALAVAGVVLFAGETLGVGVAALTAAAMVANFAVWWYARFAMPEPLAAAAIWGGLVFLCRAGRARDRRFALLAGAVLGLAGLARTESFPLLLVAGALAFAWRQLRAPQVPLLVGFALMLGVAALTGERSPNHHLAYFRNEINLHYLAILPALTAARQSGRLLAACGGLLAALVAAGVIGVRSGAGFVRGVLRVALPLGIVAALVVYVYIGGYVFPWRNLSWLALYCSWPLLALAVVGGPIAWHRGGDAVRIAGYAWMVAAALFILNPRVSAYQPWAIRRFLPLVIPGIAIAGSAALAWIATRPNRGWRLLAAALAATILVLEVRPVLRARALPYYQGNVALLRDLVGRFPPDAIVAMDSSLADLQLQVPIWLASGRETIMLREGGARWQTVMRALAATGRPVVWIGGSAEVPLGYGDIDARPMETDRKLTIVVPDAPENGTPSRRVNRVVSLRIYRIGVGLGDGHGRSRETSTSLRSAHCSGVTTTMTKSTRDSSPLPSVQTTNGL